MRINDVGSVGIGTTAPGAFKLSITEAGTYAPPLLLTAPHALVKMVSSASGTCYMGMGAGYITGASAGFMIRAETTPITFSTTGVTGAAMVITTGNNVGIGTATPTSLLDIRQAADGATEGISLFAGRVGTTEALNFYFNSGEWYISPSYSSGGALSNLYFTNTITGSTSLALMKTGLVGMGDDANANMTVGLTINQAGNDDEILALKSSDVAHGITAQSETDTYGSFKKISATLGGLKVVGLADGAGDVGLSLNGYVQGVNTAKSTSAVGAVGINVGVNTGSDVAALGSDTNLVVIQNLGTTRFVFDAEGSGHADVEWTTFSDSRLKTNVDTIPYGLDTVRGLDAKIFDKHSGYIDDDGEVVLEDGSRRMIGFIAQEVQPLVPELVTDVDDKSFYSLDVGRFTPILWSAVKTLDTTVQEYQARIEALEAALAELASASPSE